MNFPTWISAFQNEKKSSHHLYTMIFFYLDYALRTTFRNRKDRLEQAFSVFLWYLS